MRDIEELRQVAISNKCLSGNLLLTVDAIKNGISGMQFRNPIKQLILYAQHSFNGIKLDWRYTFRFFFFFFFFFSTMSSSTCHHPSWTWAVALPRFQPTSRIESTRVADTRRLDSSPPLIREIFQATNARCSRRLSEMWPDLLPYVSINMSYIFGRKITFYASQHWNCNVISKP